jgi:acyl carrier protein
MQEPDIYSRLAHVFADVFDQEDIAITSDTTSADVLGWDSLNHLRLIASVEQTFAIRFSASEVKEARNVGEFVGLIATKLS